MYYLCVISETKKHTILYNVEVSRNFFMTIHFCFTYEVGDDLFSRMCEVISSITSLVMSRYLSIVKVSKSQK